MELPKHDTELPGELIEVLWHDIGECLPRERVSQVMSEVSAEFRGATITAFLPLIVRRKTRERLREEASRIHT